MTISKEILTRTIIVAALSAATFLPLQAQPRYDKGVSLGGDLFRIGTFTESYNSLDFHSHTLSMVWCEKPSEGGAGYAAAYNYPHLSLSLSHSTLSDVQFKSPQGHYSDLFTAYGQFSRDLLRLGPFAFGYDLGLGLTYTEAKYDILTNSPNWFLGSNVNCYVSGRGHVLVRIARRLDIEASAGVGHNSSGRMNYPNGGLNYYGGGVSARWWFRETEPTPAGRFKTPEINSDSYVKGWSTEIYIGGGTHSCAAEWQSVVDSSDRETVAGTKFRHWPMASLGVDVLRRMNGRFSLGFTAEAFYASNSEALRKADRVWYSEQEIAGSRGYAPFSAGLGIVQEIHYKNIALYAKEAVYLVRKTGIRGYHGPVYDKMGLRWYPPRLSPIFFSGCIKAHMFKADYIDFSVGIKI